jgi:uncharacterized damage-inducible protein DinB
MATLEEYATRSAAQRIERLTRTADQLAAALEGQSEATLARRPDAKNWAAKEVVCHLRDTEEAFAARFDQILAMDTDPRLPAPQPDRWAEERQYLKNDAGEALGAFRRRREENLATMRGMSGEQWRKGGVHPVRGRVSLDDFLTLMAWHDDNHLDQLTRALGGSA